MTGAVKVSRALQARPKVLSRLLALLGVPCEGFGGRCSKPATVITPSQTAYPDPDDMEPDDLGPNRDLFFCGPCAEGYTEQMNAQWAEYHAGLL